MLEIFEMNIIMSTEYFYLSVGVPRYMTCTIEPSRQLNQLWGCGS